jgi:hypothetical protein
MRSISNRPDSPDWRICLRRLSGCFAVFAALLLTLAVTRASAQTACNVNYVIAPQSSSAFGATLAIDNTGTTAWTSWTLSWTFANGQTISSIWNGVESQSGAVVTVASESYNGAIAAGGALTTVGFNGTWNGTANAIPTAFTVNGTACTVNGASGTGSFTIAPSPSSLSVAAGGSATDTVTITDISPFAGAVTLSASGLPAGVTAAFATNPATGGSVVTFTAGSSAAATSSPVTVTVTGTSGSLTETATIALTVTSSSSCSTANPITPYISENGAWITTPESTATVASGTAVSLGPWPVSGGTWSWTGPGGFTSTSREIDNISLPATTNTYTATYTVNGCSYTQPFVITVSGSSNPITPYIAENGVWNTTPETAATVSAGTSVSLGPWPVSGGAWSWTYTAPGSTTQVAYATTREIDGIKLATGANVYIATYTLNGVSSTETFTITVTGTIVCGVTSPIVPYIEVSGTWITPSSSTATVSSTGTPVSLGPWPTSGGSWSWTGPNNFTSTSREIDNIPLSAGANVYTVTYTVSGCSYTQAFTITVTAATSYVLTVNSTNPASGVAMTVTYPPTTLATAGTTPFTVTETAGSTIDVAAPATANGNPFSSWTGCTSASGQTCAVTLNSNMTVTANYTPAVSGTFTLTPSAATLSVAQSASVTDTITVNDLNGFTGSVQLAASNLPSGVTATFATNPTTGSSVVTFAASSSAAVTSSPVTITIKGTSGSLSASTTVALTITAPAPPANATVTVNPSNPGIAVSDMILGMNMAAWYDPTTPGITTAFEAAGIKAVRWPGGSWADAYNWETNTECGGIANGNATYPNFVNDLVKPAGLDVSLIADYGTGENCSGYGNPAEAASWASDSLTLGANVSHITVGNEEYGSWEEDNHPSQHNPSTYASAVVSGYYPDIKAVSPNVLVGVVVDEDNSSGGWDNTVMANAKGYYDYVEYHYYPETPGQESDSFLIDSGASELTANINTIKSELSKWGTPNTPIYVGEIGGPYSNPGKQSWSITQGLYAGQVLGEMMNDGVTRLTWWIGFGNCNATAGNDSASLYGWQDFGAYNVFSDGGSDPTGSCPGDGAIGSMNPTARAFQLFSQVAVNGEHVLTPTVTGDTTDVVAYAATHSGGTALVLFNRNESSSETVSITLTGVTSAPSVTVTTYDKAIYDLSGSPTGVFPDPAGTSTWAAPTTTTLGAQSLPLSLTLAPWSMNVVIVP